MSDIVVDRDLCIECGACVALCTAHVFENSSGYAEAVAPEECWLCGHCVAACPPDAIGHSGYPTEACPPLDAFALPSLDALVAAFRERRSARIFRGEPVPRESVRKLVDISRWAPSASNEQPVDWLAFDDPDQIAALSSRAVAVLARIGRLLRDPQADFEWLAQRRAEGKDPIFFQAPVVLVAHVPTEAYFGRDDAIYAVYNLMLAAQRRGLGTCQIGYFQFALDRSRQLRRALGLPKGRQVEVTLVLGYPAFDFHRVLPRRQPDMIWNATEADD